MESRFLPPSQTLILKSDALSLIYRLPVERLLSIFHLCDPEISARLKQTHVNRHWKLIISQHPSLWTEVGINVKSRVDVVALGNTLNLLETQLDRTGSLLLDVTWSGMISDACSADIIRLIRQKGTFLRWRSLKIKLTEDETASQHSIFLPSDSFCNLETLVVLYGTPEFIIHAISQTISPKLQTVDFSHCKVNIIDLKNAHERILGLVKSIKLPNRFPDSSLLVSFLPANVTHVQARHRRAHPFPHISSYTLKLAVFDRQHPTDLRNLTNLTVNTLIHIHSGCQVFLPALLQLTFGVIAISQDAKIDAPMLEKLHIVVASSAEVKARCALNIRDALYHPGYHLWPKISLEVGLPLPEETIIRFLEKSPQLRHAVFIFEDNQCARKVMTHIFGLGARSAGGLCLQLSSLMLKFGWYNSDVALWKSRSRRAVELRQRGAQVPAIYGEWKGEGVFILLAGGQA